MSNSHTNSYSKKGCKSTNVWHVSLLPIPKPVKKTENKRIEADDSWSLGGHASLKVADSIKIQRAWSGIKDMESSHLNSGNPTENDYLNIFNDLENLSISNGLESPTFESVPTKRIQSQWAVSTTTEFLEEKCILNPSPKSTKDYREKIKSLSALKPVRTNPNVWVTADRDECDYLIRKFFLNTKPAKKFIALDIEGNVNRKMHKLAPSTIQLASFRVCIIIQLYRLIGKELSQLRLKDYVSDQEMDLNSIIIPEALSELLQSKRICKIGFGITADKQLLESHYSKAYLANYFDLGCLANALKLPQSLGKFADKFSTETIYSEKETDNKYKIWREHAKRNWDRKALTEEEVFYASRDVFGILAVFRDFIKKENSDICNDLQSRSSHVFTTILRPDVEEDRVGIENLQSDDEFFDSNDIEVDDLDNRDNSSANDMDDLEQFQSGRFYVA